jgi:hypothetical protein
VSAAAACAIGGLRSATAWKPCQLGARSARDALSMKSASGFGRSIGSIGARTNKAHGGAQRSDEIQTYR